MRIFSAGRQLGQAVKNMGRLKQILAIFAKHGFADVVNRMDLGKFLPGNLGGSAKDEQSESTVPERLRLAFEELGPTFVKFGQLLSTRSDLLPDSYIEEFVRLQDNVQPLSFPVVKEIVESELGKKIEEAYSFFDPTPLAAASIGQVHQAKLLDGTTVVVKIQRPEIEKLIETDVSLLAFLAGLMEKYVPETRILGPKTIVDEFFRTLEFELDFVVEANNIAKISENMAFMPEVVLPKVYRPLSTHKILTQEKLEGIRVTDIKALDQAQINRKALVEIGAKAFFKSVMIDGLFHGDLHAGNLFALPGNRLGIIDFGIVGRLSQKSRDQLASMVMALLTEDYENLCYEYAELGSPESPIDFDAFQREVRNALSPYLGLPLSDINVGKVLIEATKIATRHQIKVPGDWMLVFKAILTIEGMGRTLDPSFDLLSMGQELVKDLVKNQYSMQRLTKDMLWVAKDFLVLFKILPRQLRWMFRKFNSNDFAIEVKSPDFERLRRQQEKSSTQLSLSILVAGLFMASSHSMSDSTQPLILGYPGLAVVFLGLGFFFLIVMIFNFFKK
ncbi:MAG: ABC1 kinase family protein [Bdellovibrionia bacterium]